MGTRLSPILELMQKEPGVATVLVLRRQRWVYYGAHQPIQCYRDSDGQIVGLISQFTPPSLSCEVQASKRPCLKE